MTVESAVGALVGEFKTNGRIVIVGASLAGLRAAETLRDEGFAGSLTMIGDEPYEPYDRPPLSKQVLHGRACRPTTPRCRAGGHRRRLAARRRGDRPGPGRQAGPARRRRRSAVRPAADRHRRPGPTVADRGRGGARRRLRPAHPRRRAGCGSGWRAGPRRVLVIGGGFTGSEIASSAASSACPSPSPNAAAAPLVGALGGVIGAVAAELQREHGVDLRVRRHR